MIPMGCSALGRRPGILERMDGTERPGTGPEPLEPLDPSAEPRGPLTVKEAAQLLGIGERAVRKRIAARTLRADHIDGQWHVWPHAEAGPAHGTGAGTTEPGPGPEQGRGPAEPRNRAVEPASSVAVAAMQQMVQQIVGPLADANARQAAELERLHALTREQAEALGRERATKEALHAQLSALERRQARRRPWYLRLLLGG